jgi:FKBP-type peptidyl-prolyl cis-trans isomerase
MMDDTLIQYNKQILSSEDEEIEDFVHRYHWKVTTTPTGLRYMIYKEGNGIKAGKGKIVTILYTLKKINGDLIYTADPGHPCEFELGKHAVSNGLEEGVLYLKTGDRAKLILPSHLAYGLLGDLNKIPMRTILVYDVEVIAVKEKN